MTCCCFGSEGRTHESGAALVIFVVVRMALEHRPCQLAPAPGEFFLPLGDLLGFAQRCLKTSTCVRRNLREVERVYKSRANFAYHHPRVRQLLERAC